jgi:hypothetical protein
LTGWDHNELKIPALFFQAHGFLFDNHLMAMLTDRAYQALLARSPSHPTGYSQRKTGSLRQGDCRRTMATIELDPFQVHDSHWRLLL